MHVNIKKSALLATTALGAALVLLQAHPVGATTLQEAVVQGISNPEVREAEANRRATDKELREARGLYFPTVDLRGETGPENADNINTRSRPLAPGDDTDRWLWRSDASIAITQLLYDGNKTDNIVERQKARVKAAASRVVERSEFTALDVVQAYLDILRQTELVRFAQNNVSAHQSTLNDILSRVRAGRSSTADQRQSENRLTVAQTDLVNAQQKLDDARTTYLRLVRQEPTGLTRPILPAAAIPKSEDEAIRRTLSTNPSIGVADLDYQAAVADSKAAEAPFLPRLDLEVVGSRGKNIGGVTGSDNDLTVLLVAKWNLYSGGSDTARLGAARERVNEAQDRENRLRLTATEEARKSWTAMVRQRELAAKLKDRVTASQGVLDAYRQQFNVGRRDLLDVLDAQNDVYAAKVASLTADYSAQFAAYRTLAVAGGLLAALDVSAPSEAAGGRVQLKPEMPK
ncbi:MAG TPA: TolC family outer membrane protein [Alphaproteobacteria bacterium]|nr:TolC family outer membrane protein [Alphaproteobacteria bacterium]